LWLLRFSADAVILRLNGLCEVGYLFGLLMHQVDQLVDLLRLIDIDLNQFFYWVCYRC
jgi:hypothetical protein